MGRRSSDSEDDSRSRRKRKQRRRSSSSSSSSSSSRREPLQRQKPRQRSGPGDRDRRRRRRSSSSSSHSSSRRRRSRSADRDKGRSHRSHRSRSRDRRSYSHHRRSHSRSHSRRRSRSRDRSRRRDKDRDRERDRDKDRSKDKMDKRGDPGSIKSKGLEHLTPSEQAKVRMQLVLQAAAKTDEALKAKVAKREEDARKKLLEEGTSLEEQVRRIKDIEAIESDSFVPQAFKSSRDQLKVEVKKEEEKTSPQELSFPLSTVYNDTDTLAHPNLFMDKDKAEELWMKRLISLRQERLLGSPVT
ncbi:serine/Arginine-related protein 53 [Boleophthalmus pectinirostris]|uniref:serine/Arginine-related protein 53 n=1 Tax=Boleophthalmus pectinirostris TaxID=150288 RepID=UPI00242BD9C2|nr:serine/Arginine-related protein 53 [Boleophthalmus pectinirostris]